MKFIVSVIPHNDQPYNTVGDWRFSDDYKTCYINISDLGDDVYHHALALHEQAEVMLLIQKTSPQSALEAVDSFDTQFEHNRTDSFESDPGDDPKAFYQFDHGFATAIERMFLAASGKNWKQYEEKMIEVMKNYGQKTD